MITMISEPVRTQPEMLPGAMAQVAASEHDDHGRQNINTLPMTLSTRKATPTAGNDRLLDPSTGSGSRAGLMTGT